MKHLYLDLDGVLVNLNSKFKYYYSDKLESEDWFQYEKRKNIYIFDYIYERHDPLLFWFLLPAFHGYSEFVDSCITMFGVNNISVLSASTNKYPKPCRMGKKLWCGEYIPKIENIIIVEHPSHKKKYATPDSILVDDMPSNVHEWVAAGGNAILHTDFNSTLQHMEKLLERNEYVIQ